MYRHRIIQIGIGIGISLLIAGVLQLLLPKTYNVESIIMPLSGNSNSSQARIMSNFNLPLGLADLGGDTELIKFKELILTRKILKAIVTSCDAKSVLSSSNSKNPDDVAADRLMKGLEVLVTKGGMLRVSLTHSMPPEMAVCLVNDLVPALNTYMDESGLGRAKAKRSFLEVQIENKRKEIRSISDQLSSFSEDSKTIVIDTNLVKLIENYSNLLSKKVALDLKLEMLTRFQKEPSPAITTLQRKAASLEKAIEKIEVPSQLENEGGFTNIPFQKSSLLKIHYLQLKEKLTTTSNLLSLLMQQLELTRLEEVESKNYFEVVDAAVLPERPSSPSFTFNFLMLSVIVLGTYLAGYKLSGRFKRMIK